MEDLEKDMIIDCPLGNKCEYIDNDKKIHRCVLYTKVSGKNPQSEEIIDKWGCAWIWVPILLVDNTQRLIGNQAAMESFRNELVKSMQQVMQLSLMLKEENKVLIEAK